MTANQPAIIPSFCLCSKESINYSYITRHHTHDLQHSRPAS